MQFLQARARLDAQLVHQDAPRPAVGVERLGRSARPVQREHQHPAQLLPQRMGVDQGQQLGGDVPVPAQFEVGLDP
ncbi:hypothetical protein SHKM778_83560 [Streptomyces sp. KM77-8]|uniref:Uncharacterized protein n=1 Tax=Streptomyces haneummycinicus TaxID=3074435 RepID=A0AAT9HWT2_9ACTN